MSRNTKTITRPALPLKRGWTTGACATAATKAALIGLITGRFPDPVAIVLPKGEVPHFPLAIESSGNGYAQGYAQNYTMVGIIKDAGDDPDVTHGAMITSSVRLLKPDSGIVFKAGDGVGIVTRNGLPIAKGEAAINPVPRKMMRDIVHEICHEYNVPTDIEICISIPDGEEIAKQTWNPRLGIIGGLSILGTTGIVHPFSCSAWIHSIHRGIDVARAEGLTHILAATGSTSESAVRTLYNLPEIACLDMGDFAGGVLKYIRKYPLPKLTIAGGFAKMVKLAQGHLDLHSSRAQVDMKFLAKMVEEIVLHQKLNDSILNANTALEVFEIATKNNIPLVPKIALKARDVALKALGDAPIELDLIIVGRGGDILTTHPPVTARIRGDCPASNIPPINS